MQIVTNLQIFWCAAKAVNIAVFLVKCPTVNVRGIVNASSHVPFFPKDNGGKAKGNHAAPTASTANFVFGNYTTRVVMKTLAHRKWRYTTKFS